LPKDDAIFLVFNVVQLLVKKSAVLENSKIAVLVVMEVFANADLFTEKQCLQFINNFYGQLIEGALFKVKKFVVPCMLALSKHISYDLFKTKFVAQLLKFTTDPIWGVRRVCIENMPKFIEKLKASETATFI
jgi:hypothetical protein